jgi:hypothetical protein
VTINILKARNCILSLSRSNQIIRHITFRSPQSVNGIERMGDANEFNLRPGDTVLITNRDDLKTILDIFSPTLECIQPLTIDDIADHYATLVDLIRKPDPNLGLENFAVLLLEDGQDIVLPMKSFRFVQMEIKLDGDDNDNNEQTALRDTIKQVLSNAQTQNLDLVKSMAAEYIQAAYR